MKLLGIISVALDVTDILLIKFFCIPSDNAETMEHINTVHRPFIDIKKAYDSVRRKGLYMILTEFRISMKLVCNVKLSL
jgi:hypothetical protein